MIRLKNKINSMVISLIQDEIKIILTKMKVEDLIKNTFADIFDSQDNKEGYQRPLNSTQVANIYEYLMTEQHSILPTSIILAIKEEDIVVSKDSTSFELLDKLRIVDGQHRIAAMSKIFKELNEEKGEDPELITEFNNFCNWEYPVNIMLLDKDKKIDRYIEIRSFVDINKKGKKVTTDLADNNMAKIRDGLDELPAKQAYQQISSKVVNLLNSNEKSTWYHSIRIGDNSSGDRSIGISSFNLSIVPIIRKHMKKKYDKNLKYYNKNMINKESEIIADIIKDYWVAIGDKWENAFYWDDENEAYRIDSDYNIQKSLGVFSLHKILNQYFTNDNDIKSALELSKSAINNSDVIDDDWLIGGSFSSYTSSSGHTSIKNIVLGTK